MMSKNTGKPFENLTHLMFQMILKQEEIRNLIVRPNVRLQGKTTSHQIDVYWKFEVGGVSHEAIVQAKDWRKPVDQLQLLAFKAILDDLPGQPRGIFVTRTGYQEGAREFALAHGILIYELKELDDKSSLEMTAGGWAKLRVVQLPLYGVITTEEPSIDVASVHAFGFDYEVYTPRFSEIHFDVSTDWLEGEYPELDVSTIRRHEFSVSPFSEFLLFDENEVEVTNLAVVFGGIVEVMKEEGAEKKRATHVFDPPVFFLTASELTPRIKTTAVSVSVEIESRHEFRRGKIANLTQLVLRQLNSDRSWWFAATPQVISTLSKKVKRRPKRLARRTSKGGAKKK